MIEKKLQKKKIQIVFSSIIFSLLFFIEMFSIVNYKDNYILSAIILVSALIALFILVNGIFDVTVMKNAIREEQYKNIFKSEKATYLMQKKYFSDMEERMIHLERATIVPTEEIVNAQKGIAKVIVGRNKENAEALMSSNDLLMERIDDLEKKLTANSQELLAEEKNHRGESIQQILDKQQQLLVDIKDMELRLNSEILQSQKMLAEQKSILQQPPVVQQVPVMQPFSQPMTQPVMGQPIVQPLSGTTREELHNPEVDNPLMEESLTKEPMADVLSEFEAGISCCSCRNASSVSAIVFLALLEIF